MEHLIYVDTKAKELELLVHGTKTLIIRGAAGRKLPPSRVFENKVVYFVKNDGSRTIHYRGCVKAVENFVKLSPKDSVAIMEERKKHLSPAQWKRWNGKNVYALQKLKICECVEPFTYERASNMDDWIMAEHIQYVN